MRPEREFASTAKYPWRIFWILLVTAVVSALGALPYVLKLFGRKLLPSGLPTTLPSLILMQSLQGLLVFGSHRRCRIARRAQSRALVSAARARGL